MFQYWLKWISSHSKISSGVESNKTTPILCLRITKFEIKKWFCSYIIQQSYSKLFILYEPFWKHSFLPFLLHFYITFDHRISFLHNDVFLNFWVFPSLKVLKRIFAIYGVKYQFFGFFGHLFINLIQFFLQNEENSSIFHIFLFSFVLAY